MSSSEDLLSRILTRAMYNAAVRIYRDKLRLYEAEKLKHDKIIADCKDAGVGDNYWEPLHAAAKVLRRAKGVLEILRKENQKYGKKS